MHKRFKEPTLFLVVLGGRNNSCNIEQHDIRWVVAKSIEDCYPFLRKEWIGESKGLHIDSYVAIEFIDGYFVKPTILSQKSITKDLKQSKRLWFINQGFYRPEDINEIHYFSLLVAEDVIMAKRLATSRLNLKVKGKHIDDVIMIDKVNDISLNKISEYCYIKLEVDPLRRSQVIKPDWFGYLCIDK